MFSTKACTIKLSTAVTIISELYASTLAPDKLFQPGADVIKLVTAVIYCHSMVIPTFRDIKLYYLGNYHGMAVNYHGIKLFYIIGQKSLL